MDKVVLITGASRGIGAACARVFAQNGWRVLIHYNQSASMARALQQELLSQGQDAFCLKADLANPEEARFLIDQAARVFGRIDALVNNAGIAPLQAPVNDVSLEEMQKVLNVNLVSTMVCCQSVLPYFLKQGGGAVVNVSSVWGLTGASCEALYAASKAGVIGFSRSLAKEWGPSRIRVNCVAPGVIDTDMNAHLDSQAIHELQEETPLGRIGTPAEAAQAVYFLASEQASFITGQVLSPSGGFAV